MNRRQRVFSIGGTAVAVAGFVAGGVVMFSPTGTAATPTSDRATVECTNANLTATYKRVDAGMSHVFGRIVLRNTSEQTCWVRGYGGLSYVGHGNGTQVGAAADRTPSNKPRVVLEPGDKVRSAVSETSVGAVPEEEVPADARSTASGSTSPTKPGRSSSSTRPPAARTPRST